MPTPIDCASDGGRQLLTLTEVARELRCSKAHVSNLVAQRVRHAAPLPVVQLGRRKLVRREALDTWIRANEQEVVAIGGMRTGEILALQWRHVFADRVEVVQRIYQRRIDTPKTRNSVRSVALSTGLRKAIDSWRETSIDTSPDAWVFPVRNRPYASAD